MLLKDLSEDQFWAYVAGFIDGEGCVTLKKDSYHAELCLANTHLGVLEQMQARIGFGAIRWQQQQAHYKKRYVLVIKNVIDTAAILSEARPYMTIKADVAARAMTRAAEWLRLNDALEERNQIIRSDFASGTKGVSLAKRFGISPQAVSMIVNGDSWASARIRIGVKVGTKGGGRIKLVKNISLLPGEPIKPFDESRADLAAMPEDVFRAYLAAIVDGEGCIHLASKQARLDVTNTDTDILNSLHRRTGFGGVYRSTNRPDLGHKPGYKWFVQDSAGVNAVCAAVLPYLQIKSDKAIEAIGRSGQIIERKRLRDERREKILSLARAGTIGVNIASRLGISVASVNRVLRERKDVSHDVRPPLPGLS